MWPNEGMSRLHSSTTAARLLLLGAMGPGSTVSAAADVAAEKVVRICLDETEAAPLSFEDADGTVRGINADLARIPLEALGYKVEFKRLPWRRCIDHEIRSGASDAALSAAWSKAREEYAWFPRNADADGRVCRSPYALICNGPVLLVPVESAYRFKGNRQDVPQPVRITLGYAQVAEYRQRRIKVDEGPSDLANVSKMLRDGTGSALVWRTVIPSLEEGPATKGRFRIVDEFNELSDGFLPFSKSGKLTQAEVERVWEEMAKRRADPAYEKRIITSYDNLPAEVATAQERQVLQLNPGSQGSLVLCGGSLDLDPQSPSYLADLGPTLKQLVGKAQGTKPVLAGVMSGSPTSADALDAWQGTKDDVGYDPLFTKMGLEPKLVPLSFTDFAAADTQVPWLKTVQDADIVFLNGGDQARHFRALMHDGGTDSALLKSIRAVLARGGVVMGTSAGTHVAGNPMFGNGQSYDYLSTNDVHAMSRTDQLPARGVHPRLEHPRDDSLGSFGRGLGFWDGVLLDSHSSARGRLGRMIVALAAAGRTGAFRDVAVGVGVDENTCVVWDIAARQGRVIGQRGIWIADLGEADLAPAGTRPFKGHGVELSYLMSGDSFSLTRKGRLGAVTSQRPEVTKRKATGKPEQAFAGDFFGAEQTSAAVQAFVGRGLTRLEAQALPEPPKTGAALRLVLRRTAKSRFYESAKMPASLTVDRLIIDLN